MKKIRKEFKNMGKINEKLSQKGKQKKENMVNTNI